MIILITEESNFAEILYPFEIFAWNILFQTKISHYMYVNRNLLSISFNDKKNNLDGHNGY